MGKLIKVILVLISSLALLIVAAAIIIPLVVDLNDYKTEMEVAVEEKTGRTLKIDGDLDLSVFPWLGVSTGKITLNNAAGFAQSPFAVIGEADIKVKLLPLFSKKIEVSTVVLKDLELHLAKNKQGITNWHDLSAPKETDTQVTEQEQGTEDTPIDLTAIKIGGLVIENSQVSWDDQQSGQHIVIKEFNFSSGAVVFNKPIAIKIAFLLDNKEPAVTEQLSLSTSLIIDEALQKIQLADFNLDSVTKGESIPSGQLDTQLESEIFLDLQAQTLALKKLQLSTNLIHISGELNASKLNTDLQYTGALQIASFSPKELMQQLAISVPETADEQVLQKLALSFALQGTKDSIALENLKIALDDTNINGYTRIKQFDQPAVTFQLGIDDIDVDRYSAPKSQARLLPMDTLRTLNINGDLKIAKLFLQKHPQQDQRSLLQKLSYCQWTPCVRSILMVI